MGLGQGPEPQHELCGEIGSIVCAPPWGYAHTWLSVGAREHWPLHNCKVVIAHVGMCVEGGAREGMCLHTRGLLQHRVGLSVKLQVCITPMRGCRNLSYNINEGVICCPVCVFVYAHACAYTHDAPVPVNTCLCVNLNTYIFMHQCQNNGPLSRDQIIQKISVWLLQGTPH